MSDKPESFRQIRAQGRTSIRPEELKAYGIERFLNQQAARGPLHLPAVHFTEEENRLMDQIQADEREANNRANKVGEQNFP